MADLAAVRVALATTLTEITGLRTSAIFVSQVNPPMAVIMSQPRQTMRFDTLGEGVSFLLIVQLLAAFVEDSGSQAQVDAWLGTGPLSVEHALITNPTLGGVVDNANLDSVGRYGLLDWGGQTYLGAQASVTIMARTP